MKKANIAVIAALSAGCALAASGVHADGGGRVSGDTVAQGAATSSGAGILVPLVLLVVVAAAVAGGE